VTRVVHGHASGQSSRSAHVGRASCGLHGGGQQLQLEDSPELAVRQALPPLTSITAMPTLSSPTTRSVPLMRAAGGDFLVLDPVGRKVMGIIPQWQEPRYRGALRRWSAGPTVEHHFLKG
jgi:hypothetical protein